MTDWIKLTMPDGPTAPHDARPARFLLRSGEEVEGVLEPYWCGSDCPCGMDSYLDDEFPECWWLPELEQTPTHWRPL